MDQPDTDENGSFETIVGRPPANWPWALPHYYALNVVSAPQRQIVGWSATPGGEDAPVERFVKTRSNVETLGFWEGSFHVTAVENFLSRQKAFEYAESLRKAIDVRFIMSAGKILSENSHVAITGQWPAVWNFSSLRDIGVFLAFLDQIVRAKGELAIADEIKNSIRYGWPATELAVGFHDSLQLAKRKLKAIIEPANMQDLSRAITKTEAWISG